ncbi:MAG: peptide-methionine (S)-S-oxide reductase MsrA [Mariniphaga sp.]|nr:peptide-methionine (S)-S-oxide reductase MsrA [Mariniphaga sp.]
MKKILVLVAFFLVAGNIMSKELEKATLGGGCFWCTEAIYKQLNGIESVMPGYSGGHIKNPSYKEVCTGRTGHAEVVQVEFDPTVVSYTEVLEVFFSTHNPTTLNRQGADVGTQYRSAVFFHSEEQKQIAEKVINLFEEVNVYKEPIVTEVTGFDKFYPAEDYHKNYFAQNKNQPYCQMVVAPKIEKFEKIFKDKLKK